jgi:hypothetical protein
VTRLGEFLLIGQFFTLNIVMIIAELAYFLATFFYIKNYAIIHINKNGLGYILGIFSQMHPVTLTAQLTQ